MATPDEMQILQAFRKLGEADRIELTEVLSETWLGGSKKIEYLCHYLRRKGLVREVGREKGRNRYALTPKGLAIVGRR
ncbi:hypothetical protein MYX84_04055 [Acidobacteria bacterium AH-259-O06]|nr:hypothetical protein [Acidobacteria bacterium AH-259-O06]